MLAQVAKLGENYYKWVNLPVDRPLRLIENNFLEWSTKVNHKITIKFQNI